MPDTPPGPRQHFIPRHYLKGFADSPERTHVWVYNKGQPYSAGNEINPQPNPFRKAIKKVAVARSTYQRITLAGESLDADPAITKQEKSGVEVFQKLRARTPISVEDKIRFSLYIDLMRARVPAGKTHALPFVKKAMQNFNWDLLRRLAAEEGRFGLARKFDPDVPENVIAVLEEQLLRGVTQRSPEIVKQIAGMRWLFYTIEDDCFFPTTDNPAFFPPGLGLAKENGFMIMPIDSQMVLLVCNLPEEDRQYLPVATEQRYTVFRNLILAGATEKAYACRNDPDILDMLKNPRLPAG
jgi:hypothetical protein